MARLQSLLIALQTDNAFDRRAFSGIAESAHRHADTLLHVKGADEPFDYVVRMRKIDGIILSSSNPSVVAAAARTGRPCVNVSNYPEGHRLAPVVGTDDVAVAEIVAAHYLERGFQHFAFFTDERIAYFHPRQAAFVAAVKRAGYPCAVGPAPLVPPTRRRAARLAPVSVPWEEHAGSWLAALPRPLAVMAPFDAYAREAVLACRVAGLRVPADVSVIGVDNDEISCMTVWPQLSSVVTQAAQIGHEALRLLRSMIIEGAPPPPKPTFVPPSEIVIRGSSSETAVDDPVVAAAVNFIRAHVDQRTTVDAVADHVAVSRRALERRFVRALGRSPMEEVRRARIARAKRLLIETDLGLTEVARRSGLLRQQRLCSVLKAETGRTPLAFRTAFRQND